jgi:hypothetical protein
VPVAAKSNSYSLNQDPIGLKSANYMAATNENGVFALRVAIANSLNDPNFADVFRINILNPSQVHASGTYSVGENGEPVKPPCEILFFNGEKSTLLKTVAGTIVFMSYGTNTGDLVAGSFSVQVEDGRSEVKPLYWISGSFSFVVNMPGAIG